MMRAAIVSAALAGLLTACGNGEAGGSGGGSGPAAELTPAQRAAVLATLPAPYNGADLENGRKRFAQCRSCHTLAEGAPNLVGPNLHGVFGRRVGSKPDYAYSDAVRAADFIWDGARLDAWLTDPRGFLPGTKMAFPGIEAEADRRDVIAFVMIESGYRPAGR